MNDWTFSVVPKRPTTLPNCTTCGRFTSTPEVRQWCEGGNSGAHVCLEELLCPRCTTTTDAHAPKETPHA